MWYFCQLFGYSVLTSKVVSPWCGLVSVIWVPTVWLYCTHHNNGITLVVAWWLWYECHLCDYAVLTTTMVSPWLWPGGCDMSANCVTILNLPQQWYHPGCVLEAVIWVPVVWLYSTHHNNGITLVVAWWLWYECQLCDYTVLTTTMVSPWLWPGGCDMRTNCVTMLYSPRLWYHPGCVLVAVIWVPVVWLYCTHHNNGVTLVVSWWLWYEC
jgi:hypothetical protein